MPYPRSSVGRYDRSLVGTENHRPARHICSYFHRIPGCGVYDAGYSHGPASGHLEPFDGRCYAIHLSPRRRYDERCILHRHLVPGSPGPVCYAGWCTHDTVVHIAYYLRHYHSSDNSEDRIFCPCYAPFGRCRINRQWPPFYTYAGVERWRMDWLSDLLRVRAWLWAPNIELGAADYPAALRCFPRHGDE